MPRRLRPRAPISTAPISVTQLTCLQILGIDERRYLDFVRQHNVPCVRVGKLVVTEVAAMCAALRHLALDKRPDGAGAHAPDPSDADDDLESVDAVLARIGKKRAC